MELITNPPKSQKSMGFSHPKKSLHPWRVGRSPRDGAWSTKHRHSARWRLSPSPFRCPRSTWATNAPVEPQQRCAGPGKTAVPRCQVTCQRNAGNAAILVAEHELSEANTKLGGTPSQNHQRLDPFRQRRQILDLLNKKSTAPSRLVDDQMR